MLPEDFKHISLVGCRMLSCLTEHTRKHYRRNCCADNFFHWANLRGALLIHHSDAIHLLMTPWPRRSKGSSSVLDDPDKTGPNSWWVKVSLFMGLGTYCGRLLTYHLVRNSEIDMSFDVLIVKRWILLVPRHPSSLRLALLAWIGHWLYFAVKFFC